MRSVIRERVGSAKSLVSMVEGKVLDFQFDNTCKCIGVNRNIQLYEEEEEDSRQTKLRVFKIEG